MADLMIPILIIVVMLIVIESMESPLFLLMIAILWMPIGLLFLSSGNYDSIFQAPITYTPPLRWMVGGILSCVSIATSLRMIFLRRQLASEAVKAT